MKIQDILDLDNLNRMIEEKYIKVQRHPEFPLSIYNYTDGCTYARMWNNETLRCRGLIVSDDGDVIASGPKKFFNYGEPSATEYPLDTKVVVTSKEDGSLGIVYKWDGNYYVATRGSFDSDQARHANLLVRDKGLPWSRQFVKILERDDQTMIVEIVYPENQIVLNYNGRDELIKLGTVNNKTGLISGRAGNVVVDVPGNSHILPELTLAEALELPIPDEEEGYVVDILDEMNSTVDSVKLKGEWYIKMHSAIFGLTERKVWEQCVAGTHHEFVESLPDELHDWTKAVIERLRKDFLRVEKEIQDEYFLIESLGESRRDFAIAAQKMTHRPAMFLMLDGNDLKLGEYIMTKIKPENIPFSSTVEETV